MTEEYHDVNLETDHLEEFIEAPPPGQPVVVIQYRSRGLPWYVVLPLLVLVPLGAVAVYHRVSSRARRAFPPPSMQQTTRKVVEQERVPGTSSGTPTAADFPALPPASIGELGAALALNSQPMAPGSLFAMSLSPAPKADLTKPASPAPTAPATSKEGEPSKVAKPAATAKAEPGNPVAGTPPPSGPRVKDPTPLASSNAPDQATRPAPRGAVAVGFSVPADDDSPFADFDISRSVPDARVAADRAAPSAGPTAAGDSAPARQPQPTQEQLLQDIQAEAAEKKAELKQLRNLKDRARDAIGAESQVRVEEERAAFRRDLDEAVKLGGKQGGQQIDDLCNRYGRNYDDQLRSKATYLLSRFGGKRSREEKVRLLRLYGVPEAGILDFLANDIHHMINSRNGPRDFNEVRINAAKQLLSFKLVKDGGGAAKGLPAQRGRPGTAAAPNSAPGNAQAPRAQ
jgi:hypothetical protein